MESRANTAAIKLAVKHYINQMLHDWRYNLPGFLLPAIGSVLVFYVPPLIVARVLSNFSNNPQQDLTAYTPYILLFLLLWSLGELCWRVGIHYLIISEVKGTQRLLNSAMTRLLGKDLDFFHNNFAGSLTKRITSYGWRYIELVDTLAFSVFSAYLPIIFVVFILWQFSPYLVLGLLGLMFLTGFLIFPLVRRRQKLVAAREASSTKMSGYVADILSNIDAVKAFANEDLESKNHAANVEDLVVKTKQSWNYQNLRIDAMTSPFFVLTNTVGLLLALWVSKNSNVSLEVVFVTFNYYVGVTRTMWEFNHVYRNLETSITEGAQFTELLLNAPKVNDVKSPAPLKIKSGDIDMKDVTFTYGDASGEHLFKDFNLAIKSGEKVALVGRSGGGKSTVTRLLLRYMDINGGQITIDGQDIAKVKQQALRSKIAYVPQEPVMFHRSLTDNIRYGKLDATQEEVEKVAELAHAHEFINKLPQGYDTLVGERGVKLSGGQRQRIAIARALIKDAPILLLDEATSALDSESESLIQDALWKLMEGRTAVVIAHRLSTIQKMDRIIVLDEGKIAEEGSHKELLQNNGIYAKLWTHQSGGFIDET